MVAPTFKKPTDTSPSGSVVYGAPDLKYVLDVLDGTHATDRLQQVNIEGLNPFFNYKAVMYKAGSVCKAFKDDGTLISSDTDAKVVLQAAINSITASGGKGKLVIKDGVYTINRQWTMPSNVEIWGESRDNTILKSASSILATQCKNSDATGGNVNLTLANLTIDHIDVPLGDTNGACVSWNRVSKSTMYNCHMKNGASFTVFWSGNEVDLFDNVIANNIIDCDERTSKPLKDMWGGGNLCDSIMVNNVFRNGGGSGLCVIRTPKRLICASNSVHNGVVAGISMETGIETIIANNVVRDCAGGGIKIPASTHGEGNGCLITGNVSRDNADRGINAVGDNHIISNNFVYANDLVGIEVSGSNCIVSGNIIKNNGRNTSVSSTFRAGIRLTNAVDSVVNGNRVYDNQGTKTQTTGILEAGTSNFSIVVGNNARGNATAAITLVGANSVSTANIQ